MPKKKERFVMNKEAMRAMGYSEETINFVYDETIKAEKWEAEHKKKTRK